MKKLVTLIFTLGTILFSYSQNSGVISVRSNSDNIQEGSSNRPNDNSVLTNGDNGQGSINNNSTESSTSTNIVPNNNTNNGVNIYTNGYPYINTNTNNNNTNSYNIYTNTNNDDYGSTVIMDDGNGNTSVVTSNSNDAPIIEDRINNHYVHFSGLVMSDIQNRPHTSKAYIDDACSDMLTIGSYWRVKNFLPNSTKFTFDGIAIAPGTRLIIYSRPNFKGHVLIDVTGPAIINNSKWQYDDRYIPANNKTYVQELQYTFPQNVRRWSVSNMHKWQNGSIEIMTAD